MGLIVKALVQILLGVIVFIVGLIFYVAYAEHSAMRNATEFCASVSIGERADRLLERARASGADERKTRWFEPRYDDRSLSVTFTGAVPLSRHICSIKATNVVTSAQYVYLD
jgi:hypothetical protein